jgi:hypothetical protein
MSIYKQMEDFCLIAKLQSQFLSLQFQRHILIVRKHFIEIMNELVLLLWMNFLNCFPTIVPKLASLPFDVIIRCPRAVENLLLKKVQPLLSSVRFSSGTKTLIVNKYQKLLSK